MSDHETNIPPNYTLLELNRSEAVKSVYLSMLLQHPGALNVLMKFLRDEKVTMRNRCCFPPNDRVNFSTECGDGEPMVSPLFYVHRDFHSIGLLDEIMKCTNNNVACPNVECPKNEIDIVIVWPKSVVLGLELKWLSSLSGIDEQLGKERTALNVLAKYYKCPHVSLVVVLPNSKLSPNEELKNSEHHDSIISMKDLTNRIYQIPSLQKDTLFGTIIKRQLDRTYPEYKNSERKTVKEILEYKVCAGNFAFVACSMGLGKLADMSFEKMQNRGKVWKTVNCNMNVPPNGDWVSLHEVRKIITTQIELKPSESR